VYEAPHNGRVRRYYQITQKGRERYNQCATEWQAFVLRVDKIMAVEQAISNYQV